MPPVWGKKYLDELGLESWEQLAEMAKRALEEKDREWEAEVESRRLAQRHAPPRKAAGKVANHEEEGRHTGTRRIAKAKVRKAAPNEVQHKHQTVAPTNQDSHDGMSKARSVDDSTDADNVESSGRDKSESAGLEISPATGSGDSTSSDDSGTTRQEASLKRDVDVDMNERKTAIEA
ncbi:hypothetical protein CEP54_013920 [Fusarium duplospermum]|uniref:Uncharacterized protein n=1 Tax=Fusarium duplospermum TaxID=1325734 RepID=A0A428NZN6_9HYPO|nr:hypothetical protein CEP54_013920 [Fusarium duplospermum]